MGIRIKKATHPRQRKGSFFLRLFNLVERSGDEYYR